MKKSWWLYLLYIVASIFCGLLFYNDIARAFDAKSPMQRDSAIVSGLVYVVICSFVGAILEGIFCLKEARLCLYGAITYIAIVTVLMFFCDINLTNTSRQVALITNGSIGLACLWAFSVTYIGNHLAKHNKKRSATSLII